MTLLDHSPPAGPIVRPLPAQPTAVRPRRLAAGRAPDRYLAVLLTVACSR